MIRSPAGFDGGDRIKRYLDYYQPSYGVMMLSAGQFSPALLFAAGEVGAWYDPSDFSTMFQDRAGTTPVTAVEQPVGLLLDKSKGLALGSELVTNGEFSNGTTGWVTTNVTNSGGTVTVVDNQAVITRGSSRAEFYQTITTVIGATYKFVGSVIAKTGSVSWWAGTTRNNASNLNLSVVPIGTQSGYFVATATTTYITASIDGTTGQTATIDNISIKLLAGNHATQATSANRPVLSARVNQLLATATLATQNVTTRAATYTLAFSGAGTVTTSGTNVGVYSAGVNSLVCTAGTLTLTVSGSVTLADLRVTNDGVGLPAYQAVITSTNYDTSGFPLYLSFDGTNDSLATGTITPGTNKVQVFAGVRKLSDAAQAIVAELSATIASNAGSFALTAPNSAAANYNFSSKGTTQTDNVVTTYTSPLTNVLSGIGDIAGPSNVIRVNGAQVGSVITTQGTGNYLAYPLYIGRRAGTSLAFTGNIYSLIIRFGSNLPTSTIAQTETWVNGKTLAY